MSYLSTYEARCDRTERFPLSRLTCSDSQVNVAMALNSDFDDDSVLDEIRSTIASLQAMKRQPAAELKRTEQVRVGASSLGARQQDEGGVPFANHAASDMLKPPVAKAIPATPVPLATPVPVKCPAPESIPAVPVSPSSLFRSNSDSEGIVPTACVSQSVSLIMEDVAGAAAEAEVEEHEPAVKNVRNANRDARIMIVDDEPLNIMTLRQHLKGDGYKNFICCEKSTEALSLIRDSEPDVLLLDINMPEVSGLDIMRVVGLDPALQHIPVLVLTAATDPAIRREALDLGASDFLSKPVEPDELIPRVRNAVILKQHFDMVTNEAARLERQVERRTRQLEATRQQLILSLARAAEHRDDDTGNHVLRVGRYAAIIAAGMGYPEDQLLILEQAAQLHDVGKIGIPDSILFKPGRLDPEQFELMQRHCALGKQIIQPISEKEWEVLKTHTRRGENLLHVRSSPLLMLAARIAQTHHEKYDGSGYPLGLSGKDIPLEGRIVAVADVFDALSSARPYKKPFSREKSFQILEDGRGTHFDPEVLDAFFRRSEQIISTQLTLMDEQPKFVGGEYVDENLGSEADLRTEDND